MTDNDLYARVRDEFGEFQLRTAVDDITTRGTRLRRRRRTVTALGLAAVAAAGLALALPADQQVTPAPPLQLAAWSVEAQPDGTVLLTIRQLTDADQLTAALKKAGVPAKVEFVKLRPGQTAGCVENGQPSSPLLLRVLPMPTWNPNPDEQIFTIHRDRMPPGTSLHFVIMEQPGTDGVPRRSVENSLVEGEPLPCKLAE
ncbi:hypothetical protein AB0F81_14485 [Actinoplanes sp. NPDC024001]|uniref:hypothetical protein n=1 Tax=Actinoplanes sp. NPDC024001 TaxID=3154598 RepID=UPI0033E0F0DD